MPLLHVSWIYKQWSFLSPETADMLVCLGEWPLTLYLTATEAGSTYG